MSHFEKFDILNYMFVVTQKGIDWYELIHRSYMHT